MNFDLWDGGRQSVIEGEAWVLWDSSSSLLGFVHVFDGIPSIIHCISHWFGTRSQLWRIFNWKTFIHPATADLEGKTYELLRINAGRF
ncbi:hypothetical protein Peur_055329 [Populus x canadensis]